MRKTFKFNLSATAKKGFDGENMGGAEECVNFALDNGRLIDGFTLSYALFGIDKKKVSIPENFTAEKIYCAKTVNGERLLVFGKEEGKASALVLDCDNPESGFASFSVVVDNPIFALARYNGENVIAITDGGGGLYLYDGAGVYEGSCPSGALALVWHFNRLIAITNEKIYLSLENDPFSFTYASHDVFDLSPGVSATNAVVFGDELIIAGNRGLCRLVYNFFDRSFTIRNVYAFGERIYPKTLVSSTDGVCVLSERGLAVYDGAEVRFSFGESVESFSEGNLGFIYEGKYHAVINPPENAENHRIMVFDDNRFYTVDANVKSACVRGDNVTPVFICNGRRAIYSSGGKFAPPVPIRKYRTRRTDFGFKEKKTITEFSVYTAKTIKAIIEVDGKKHLYRILNGKNKSVIRPFVKGNVFSFEFVCEDCGTEIYAPEVTLEVNL